MGSARFVPPTPIRQWRTKRILALRWTCSVQERLGPRGSAHALRSVPFDLLPSRRWAHAGGFSLRVRVRGVPFQLGRCAHARGLRGCLCQLGRTDRQRCRDLSGWWRALGNEVGLLFRQLFRYGHGRDCGFALTDDSRCDAEVSFCGSQGSWGASSAHTARANRTCQALDLAADARPTCLHCQEAGSAQARRRPAGLLLSADTHSKSDIGANHDQNRAHYWKG